MTRQEFSSLSHHIRERVALKYTGQLLLVLAALYMVALAASLIFGEYLITVRYILIISLLAVTVSALNLPDTARVICYYRSGKFVLADSNSKLKEKDEVIVITMRENISALKDRWAPKINNGNLK
ncbi:MAG: hypothetical protein C4538_03265 [Nitrospiraceae bacterium]|nr:MAG: hypothetical protein C4538_03265 [Nitrospiraceae bacterium]